VRAQFVRALPRDASSGRLPEPPAEEAREASAPKDDFCPSDFAALPLESVEALAVRITGRWRICKGTLRVRPDARGLDLFGAQQAFGLVDLGDAVLQRSRSWDHVFDVRARVSETEVLGAFVFELANLAEVWGYVLRVSWSGDAIELTELGSPDEMVILRRER
jgi:hypothetical protein